MRMPAAVPRAPAQCTVSLPGPETGPAVPLPGPAVALAHPQAVVVQVDPGLLRMLLLQELVGLHAALAGLLRLRPREAHLAGRDTMASGLGHVLGCCPSPTRRPGAPHLGHSPHLPAQGFEIQRQPRLPQ